VREYFHSSYDTGKRVLLYGAGDAGCMILREMFQNPKTPYSPVGFIDDDPGKVGRNINNIPVLGGLDDLDDIVATKNPHEIIITMPSISRETARKITDNCRRLGVPAKTLPMISELIEGKVNLDLIREVNISDLLRRSPKSLDPDKISSLIKGSRVLITGAGGSIGSEIARQCIKYRASKIFLLDSSEYSLYKIHLELSNIPDSKTLIFPLLDDLKSLHDLEYIFKTHKPDTVFHAAAYKHVPMVEYNPHSALTNNVLSTRNIVRTAHNEKVKKFVMISTDKAVRPTSLMGASKRICELYVQNFNKTSSTEFITVRFGNVLGSSGSVVPLFKEQILKGGPVTVTDPEMVRYFMLIPEAVQLVLQAGAMGRGGEIFILDMGDPVKISDMARDLIYLMGFVPDEDIKIEYTGLRPGEKLYEELLTDESELKTQYEDILIGRVETIDLAKLEKDIDELLDFAAGSRTSLLIKKVKELVKDFKPQNQEYADMIKSSGSK
jgi:FlaA1/EpsC-like NDP-sugar epimerase